MSSWHQIVVIGNGFDLQCGLRSGFTNFYEARRSLLYEVAADSASGLKFGERLKKQGLTVWDIILDCQSGALWCDIEGVIAEWVTAPSYFGKVRKHIARAQTGGRISGYSNLHQYVTMPDKGNFYGAVARYLLDVYPDLNPDSSELVIAHVFLAELNKLEDCFKSYLLDQVDGNVDYQNRAQGLFSDIAHKGAPDPDTSIVDTSVLSFNYTSPKFSWSKRGAFVHVVNIHGRLSDEIIFGIDGKDCMDDDLALPFTKTYRLMSRKKRISGVACYADHDALICGKVDAIKFYGHSLSKADYSYFQAMFDATDLYSGSTALVFYYRPCPAAQDESVRTEVMKSAISLLSTYGTTLDNKDHGTNLIHKLLLEDRLFVERVR